MRQKISLIVILIIATLPRLYHLQGDLPAYYEEATPMHQAWGMWHWEGAGFDLNPHFFNYPSLSFYIHFAAQLFYFGINYLIGRFPSPEAMRVLLEADPTERIMLARLLTVAFGLAIVWAVHRLGKLCHNANTGLIAASVMALATIPISTSRIILVDPPLVFFGTLALCDCILLLKHPTRQTHMRCGLWIGLATASKYTGALFAIPYIVSILLIATKTDPATKNERPSATLTFWQALSAQALPIAYAFGTTVLVFFITSPYCLLDFNAFWKDFSFERLHMATGHFGVNATQTTSAYALDLWHSLGIGLVMALTIGLVTLFSHLAQHRNQIPAILFVIIYLGIINSWSMQAAHYLLPIFPMVSIFIAIGIQTITQRLHRQNLTFATTLILLVPTCWHTLQHLPITPKPDTRTIAKTWIQTHIPPGSLLAMESYTPDLDPNTFAIAWLPFDVVYPDKMVPFYDLGWYEDFDYIITSDGVAKRYRDAPDPFAKQIQFYDTLEKKWTRVATFEGEDVSGPTIRIYHRPRPQQTQPKPFSAKQYDTLIGVNSDLAKWLLTQLARLFHKKGWYDKAIDVYSYLLPLAPNDANLLAEMGMVLYETGHNQEAAHMFSQALQHPLSQANFIRGTMHFITGQFDSAIIAWEQTIKEHTPDVPLLTNLGAAYFQQDDTTRATTMWERGLQQDPTNLDLINNLLFIYRQHNQTDRATTILRNALKIQPNNALFQSALNDLTMH